MLSINGSSVNWVGSCTLGAVDLLRALPRGAYTTARTSLCGRSIFDFKTHVTRTASSAQSIQAEEGQALDASASPEILGALMRAGAAAALTRARAAAPAPTEFKVTMLRLWGEERCAEALRALAPALSPPLSTLPSMLPSQTSDVPVSMLLTHVAPLAPPRAPPVRAVACGAPRAHALAKDSAWVSQRAALEAAAKGPGIEEVLLVDAQGGITEGTQTNLFAITRAGALQTAGEGVLEGTVRGLLLSLAAEQGIPVLLTAPLLSEAHSWRGAFLTSTSRLLLPLDELAAAPGAEPLQLPRGDPLVARLAKALEAAVEAHSEMLLPE